jgi:2-iminobutanoate/2-iminopropanoate deaminase
MQFITTPEAPLPAGHYSQAVVHNGTVYVSGLLAVDAKTGEKKLGEIEEQTEQVLTNLASILKAAGSNIEHVVKVTVYISDIGLWSRFNAVYANFFGGHKPARAVVPTRDLHHGFVVELECVAGIAA